MYSSRDGIGFEIVEEEENVCEPGKATAQKLCTGASIKAIKYNIIVRSVGKNLNKELPKNRKVVIDFNILINQ